MWLSGLHAGPMRFMSGTRPSAGVSMAGTSSSSDRALIGKSFIKSSVLLAHTGMSSLMKQLPAEPC